MLKKAIFLSTQELLNKGSPNFPVKMVKVINGIKDKSIFVFVKRCAAEE